MHGEIITIGDELTSGRVCDLNSFFLSARVSSFGLKITAMSSVGDDRDSIIDALNRAVARSDFVLVSGGLGPTDDDITTKAAADFFGLPLVQDENFLENIKKSLAKFGLTWAESYAKLALIPQGATLIAPDQSCGFLLHHGRVPVFFLPGVPREVHFLAEAKVLPVLLRNEDEKIVVDQRIFKIFGLQEGQIGEALRGLSQPDDGITIGYYPNFPENHVAVTVRAPNREKADAALARIEAQVRERLGQWVVALDGANLEEMVGRRLTEKGLTLAVAESCTGGQISQRLTSVSGASLYFERGLVVYSNQAKEELLGVPAEALAAHGAVSAEIAVLMAEGVRKRSGTDLGLASTGIAGPTGGTPDKPVGTVYLALAAPEGTHVKRFNFSGRRDQVTSLTSETAINWLRRYLSDDAFILRHKPA
ncbi:MAG: competence/damage-inducible protein A [Pseudomonadota bacterium]